jgi:cytochrome P450
MKIAKMRHESPVFYDPKLESWIVFRYQDVKRILSEWETFLSKIPRDLRSTEADKWGGFMLINVDFTDYLR